MSVYFNNKRAEVVRYQRLGRLVSEATDLGGLTLILRSYLEARPMGFDGRCLLRRIQIDAYDSASNFLTPLKERWNKLRLPMLLAQANEALDKEPEKAVQMAEDILSVNPYDEQGNRVLLMASRKLGMPKLGVLAMETVCRRQPDNMRLALDLAAAYQADHDFDEAREIYQDLLERQPDSVEVREGLARLSKAQAAYKPREESPESVRHDQAPQGDYEAREMFYSVMPLVNPLAEESQPVRTLCSLLEPIEDQGARRPAVVDEWFTWIETELGPARLEVESDFQADPENPVTAIRLGFLRSAFLELPEARMAFDAATAAEDDGLSFLAYAAMTCCLMHEGALMRNHSPVAAPAGWYEF